MRGAEMLGRRGAVDELLGEAELEQQVGALLGAGGGSASARRRNVAALSGGASCARRPGLRRGAWRAACGVGVTAAP